MAAKTPKDLEKLYKQMSEQFGQFALERQAGAAAGTAPGEPHVLIEQARANLEAAVRDRDEVVRMADLRIERWQSELARLESSLQPADRPVEEAPPEEGKPKARKRTGQDG